MKKVFLIITGLLFTLLLAVSTGGQAGAQKNNFSCKAVFTGNTAATDHYSFSIAHSSANGEIELPAPVIYHASQSVNERKTLQVFLFIIAFFLAGRLFLLKYNSILLVHSRPFYLQLIFPFHFFW